MIQRSEEWLEARMGKITASRVGDIVPGARGKYLASREAYMMELATEILTGKSAPFFENEAMRWGTEMEPVAVGAYEAETGRWVKEEGFRYSEKDKMGASPDGLIEEDGSLEIKCPNTSTLLKLRATGKINPKHLVQMNVVMLVWGRQWCDYFVYDPRLETNQFFMKRIERNEEVVNGIIEEVAKFHVELLELVEKLK